MTSLHAVVMAGGSGTRFWPASRAQRPKQFLPLAHGKPLIEATLDRLPGLFPKDNVWVATNRRQAKALTKLLPGLPRERLILEPEARDTAPCVALATATIAAADPAATIAFLPADHMIEPVAEFHGMLRRGAALAGDGASLVTFGVRPTAPITGYGYLECGDRIDRLDPPAFAAKRFREKPDAATAKQFVTDGNFLWNTGIFVWTVPAIRAAMERANPPLAKSYDELLDAVRGGKKPALARAFAQTPKLSIDYAVMEKADKVVVVEAPVRWDDVGSFPALAAVAPPDDALNVTVLAGDASAIALQSRGNVVYAEGPRTVALFGAQGLVVVAVGDAVLVCPRDRAGDLKTLVEHVRAQGRADLL